MLVLFIVLQKKRGAGEGIKIIADINPKNMRSKLIVARCCAANPFLFLLKVAMSITISTEQGTDETMFIFQTPMEKLEIQMNSCIAVCLFFLYGSQKEAPFELIKHGLITASNHSERKSCLNSLTKRVGQKIQFPGNLFLLFFAWKKLDFSYMFSGSDTPNENAPCVSIPGDTWVSKIRANENVHLSDNSLRQKP